MAVSELYTGTEAVGATEWSCTTDTSGPDVDTNAGTFQVFLDTSDMIAGDQLQIRIYEKTRSGDTQRVLYESILTGTMAATWVSPILMLKNGWDVTLKALAGTITVLWSIRQNDSELAAIKTKTDYLPSATAGAAGGVFIAGTNAATTITTGLTTTFTGNLTGSVATVAANGITSTSIATDAINAAAVKADAVTKIQNGLATPTNITAGTITTVTTLTNLPTIPANWITAAGITAAALNGKGDWNVGKTGYALTATTGLGNQTADITGNLSGSVGSVTGAVGSVTGSVGSVTGAVGSVTGAVGSVTGLTASDVGAIKTKTDSLTFTAAGMVDANVQKINDVTITGDGQVGTEFGV